MHAEVHLRHQGVYMQHYLTSYGMGIPYPWLLCNFVMSLAMHHPLNNTSTYIGFHILIGKELNNLANFSGRL